jgi:hypothetical protein
MWACEFAAADGPNKARRCAAITNAVPETLYGAARGAAPAEVANAYVYLMLNAMRRDKSCPSKAAACWSDRTCLHVAVSRMIGMGSIRINPSFVPFQNVFAIPLRGLRTEALDPDNAEALWKKSEEMVGESF